ncbi:MAG TPA: hypothetical protein VM283_01365, partial [Armatimonadota bacterium]|nr:hypothetical protein [Armatimonadota bacterium]
TLAEEGVVRAFLDPAADETAATLLRRLVQERFGIRLGPYDPVRRGELLVDLAEGDVPERWAGRDLHVTDRYPGPGEYVIHIEPAVPDQPARMSIFGRDAAGLEKGIRMWLCFLRAEHPGAVRSGDAVL